MTSSVALEIVPHGKNVFHIEHKAWAKPCVTFRSRQYGMAFIANGDRLEFLLFRDIRQSLSEYMIPCWRQNQTFS